MVYTNVQSNYKHQATVQEKCRCETKWDTQMYRVTTNIRQLYRKSAGVRQMGYTNVRSNYKGQATVQENCRCEATRDTQMYRLTTNIRQLTGKVQM